jgi:ATP-dependent DNA ligase
MIDLMKFKPQLVGEGDVNIFLFNNDGVFVEPKIDGVRILCHKKNNEVKFYTRSCADWTKRFESVIPKIIEGILGNDVIVDGEMTVLQDGKILSSNSVIQKNLQHGQRLVYFIFDVLQIGQDLLYKEVQLTRKQTLNFLIQENENICLIPFICTNNIVDIQEFYKKMVSKGMEGIVIKNCSPYHPGERYNWLKLKPLRTLDLMIVDRKERKDKQGWVYTLAENSKIIGTTSSNLEIANGTTVEVGYDIKYPRPDGYKLRFPKIIRIREDK